MKTSRSIIVGGIAAAVVVTTVALSFFLVPKEMAVETYELPNRHPNFSYPFSFPEISEVIDRSKEPKAWIGYDESYPNRSDLKASENLAQKQQRGEEYWLRMPNSIESREAINKYPVLKRVIAEHKSEWISNDLAREMVNDFKYSVYGLGVHSACGQYKYMEIYPMVFATSDNDFAFVSLITFEPNTTACYDYPPILDYPSTMYPTTPDTQT